MHNAAHIVLEDVLVACNAVHHFGDRAATTLENQQPLDLSPQEIEELNRAFKLMRETMDCVDPLINAHAAALHAAHQASA
ncbi:hypothetical protein [Pseudomonas zeae]|uniref:hypothetical protein n=1 Tax=Pseudomonas zeae TaxID=2745510 RepID=UPI0039E0745A